MAILSNINDKFAVDSTGAIQFNGQAGTSGYILKSNGNAAPTWVAASTVIGGPYLPLSGGTLTGATATASGISFTFGGALTANGAVSINNTINFNGGNQMLWKASTTNAKINMDARVSGTGVRIHKWNRNANNDAYVPYYENWYDGNSYHSIGIEGNIWRLSDGLEVAGNTVIGFSGSWNGANMPGSRWNGYAVNGGEVVFQRDNPSSARMSMLVDGQYYAGENGGFYSLYSGNDYNNRRGFNADSNGVLQFNGDVQAPGLYVGSRNASFDFYNNGTSYFNGVSTFDDNILLPSASHFMHIGDGLSTTGKIKFGNQTWNNALGLESYWMTIRTNQNEGLQLIDSAGYTYVKFNASNNSAGAYKTTFSGSLVVNTNDSNLLTLNRNSAVGGYMVFRNANSDKLYIGSRGTVSGSGGTGYDIYTVAGNDLRFFTNGTNLALTLDTSQNAVFSSDVLLSGDMYQYGSIFRTSSFINLLNNRNTKKYLSSPYFTNGDSNQAVNIQFPNVAMQGYYKITLSGSYSHQDISGKLTKVIPFGYNPNGSIWRTGSSQSEITIATGGVSTNFTIGNLAWDSTNSKFIIPIYKLTSTGNSVKILVEYLGGAANNLSDVTLSAKYTQTAPSPFNVRQYQYIQDRLGVGTISPNKTLTVYGSNDNGIWIDSQGGQYTSLAFGHNGSEKANIAWDNTNGYTNISTYSNGHLALTTGGSISAFLNYSGNLGIGTTAPSCGTIGGTPLLHAYNNTNGAKPTIHVSCHDYDEAALLLSENSGGGGNWGARLYYEGSGDNFFNIQTVDSGSVRNPAFSLNRYGRTALGFNTANPAPQSLVQIGASFNQNLIFTNRINASPFSVRSDGSSIFQTNTGANAAGIMLMGNNAVGWNAIEFYHKNTSVSQAYVGRISTNSSSTSYVTSSDYRLKENVIPMSDSISRINQLKPSRFNFIIDPETTVDGFLAHEVQDIVPEAIVGDKDEIDEEGNPVYQGIDQAKLVPLLVAAIQELEARVKELENK